MRHIKSSSGSFHDRKQSFLSVVGQPLSGNVRNTRSSLNLLVRKTLKNVSEKRMWQILIDHVEGFSTKKKPAGKSERIFRMLLSPIIRIKDQEHRFVPKDVGVTLVGSPSLGQQQTTPATPEHREHFLRQSLSKKGAKSTILKKSKHKSKEEKSKESSKAVGFKSEKPTQVHQYFHEHQAAPESNFENPRVSQEEKRTKTQRKQTFLSVCCCCFNDD